VPRDGKEKNAQQQANSQRAAIGAPSTRETPAGREINRPTMSWRP